MKGSVIALGTFDGVHMGHRALFSRAGEIAGEKGLDVVIYTFANHPLTLFGRAPRLLMSAGERMEALRAFGRVEADAFDETLASLSPQEFAEMLVQRFNARAAVAGFNYTFGKRGAGDTGTLRELGDKLGFEVNVIPPVQYAGEGVSSSRIRECIDMGDIEAANAMLCAPYALSGEVVSNRHIGTTIGFPTANIRPDPEKVVPQTGVYASRATVDDRAMNAVTNIGTNPTVNGRDVTVETHIMGFSGDIYGKQMRVEFQKRLRGDVKFASIGELAEQIGRDKAEAERFFASARN